MSVPSLARYGLGNQQTDLPSLRACCERAFARHCSNALGDCAFNARDWGTGLTGSIAGHLFWKFYVGALLVT